MAVTLVVFVAIQVLAPMLVRPHLIPPVQTTRAFSTVQIGGGTTAPGQLSLQVLGISGRPGAWILADRVVGAAGSVNDPVRFEKGGLTFTKRVPSNRGASSGMVASGLHDPKERR